MSKWIFLPLALLVSLALIYPHEAAARRKKHVKRSGVVHVVRTVHTDKADHADKPAKAKTAASPQIMYDKAAADLKALIADKKKKKQRVYWDRVITQLDRVITKYPDSPYAGYATFTRGEAFGSLYLVTRADSDQAASVKAYEDLALGYPDNEYADEALQRAGEARLIRGEKDFAANDFSAIVEGYPKSPYVARAKERLRSLPKATRQADTVKPAVKSGSQTKAAASTPASAPTPPPAKAATPVSADLSGLALVKNIRHWSNDGNTRVVVDLDGDVTYTAQRIKEPDRLFFDVKKATISSPLKDGPIAINDGILKAVRASRFDLETVRVVLDLESIASYRALMLSNPPRLVVDVTGAKARQPVDKPKHLVTLGRTERDRPAPETPSIRDSVPAHGNKKKAKSKATSEDSGEMFDKSSGGASAAPDNQPDEEEAVATKKESRVDDGKPLSLARQMGLCVGTIVIDPGHGGKDTGAIGPKGTYEKDVVLDVGLRLRDVIEKETGCKVVMTRDTDDFIDLDARPGVAVQQDADLFVSIHANASKNKKARGVETYLLNLTKDRDIMEVAARENMTTLKNMGALDSILKDLILDNKRDESLRLAHAVQDGLIWGLKKSNKKLSDKGVKQGPFLVLYGASMPSILTEVGFISNPDEEKLLSTGKYRQKVAEAIFEGLRDYISTTKVASYQPGE